MSGKPALREKILDEFEAILIEEGERSATMDAVAQRAGVSRGGLIYHFASKEAMVDGLMGRLRQLAQAGVADLLSAPEGAVERYILSAAPPLSPLDRAIVAGIRLVRDSRPEIAELFREMHRQWLAVLVHATKDLALARVIMLVGDGIYYHTITSGQPFALSGEGGAAAQIERSELMDLVRELMASRGARQSLGELS